MSCDYDGNEPKIDSRRAAAGLLTDASTIRATKLAVNRGGCPARTARLRRVREAIAQGTYFVPADQLADVLLRSAGKRDNASEEMYPA